MLHYICTNFLDSKLNTHVMHILANFIRIYIGSVMPHVNSHCFSLKDHATKLETENPKVLSKTMTHNILSTSILALLHSGASTNSKALALIAPFWSRADNSSSEVSSCGSSRYTCGESRLPRDRYEVSLPQLASKRPR